MKITFSPMAPNLKYKLIKEMHTLETSVVEEIKYP